MTEQSAHLDLDALADLLAGGDAPAHLAGCPTCTDALAELRAADERVAAALRTLPAPPLPDGLADRLNAALSAARPAASVTTLPAATPRRAARWLPAAAAAVLVLGGVAFGVSRLAGSDDTTGSGDRTSALAAPESAAVRNDTGADYTGRTDLAAAVPNLLAGTAADKAMVAPAPVGSAVPGAVAGSGGQARSAAAADPLDRLRQDPGLAECLTALLPPEDPSVRPLALDYASYKGTPALVVVLPGVATGKLDVYVVGAGCAKADASVLFYASVDAP